MESVDTYSAKVDYIPVRVLDKQYYLANFKVSKRAEPTTEDEKLLFARNNSFIMILDQSGSMAGGPWTALVEGAKQVATRIYELNEFNNFATFFFSDKWTEMKSVSLNDFTSKIHKLSPNNSTNFVSTFTKIWEYTENINPTDITVLFLTDGLDTWNGTDAVQTSLNQMKEFLRIILK